MAKKSTRKAKTAIIEEEEGRVMGYNSEPRRGINGAE